MFTKPITNYVCKKLQTFSQFSVSETNSGVPQRVSFGVMPWFEKQYLPTKGTSVANGTEYLGLYKDQVECGVGIYRADKTFS